MYMDLTEMCTGVVSYENKFAVYFSLGVLQLQELRYQKTNECRLERVTT